MSHNTFHVAIYVKDIPTAVEHYKKIFGLDPAKVKADYAKFELADPPVIFSSNLGGEPGTVSHLGIRYPGSGEVVTELLRTKRQGLEVLEQQGTTCCYAKADKFWVRDADRAQWEMYTLLEDVEARTAADANPCGFLGRPQARETPAQGEATPTGACCAPTGRGQ